MAILAPVSGSRQTMTGFGGIRPSQAVVVGPAGVDRLRALIATRPAGGLVARGAGLSYGDAAQNGRGIVVSPVTSPAVAIDQERQTVTASAATPFAEILRLLVPAGFILPVLPGTSQLTVGGALAADIHGTNHSHAGSLSAWVEQVELMDGTGELRQLSPGSDAAGLYASLGGMGLTGVMLTATIRLRRITSDFMAVTSRRAGNLDSVLSMMKGATSHYSVAWIDATATGAALGRGVVTTAYHANGPDPALAGRSLSYRRGPRHHAPAMAASLVTPVTARAFNSLWYRKAPAERAVLTDLATYFTPLDAVHGWNRLAGPQGLVQYQFVVPFGAESVLSAALAAVQAGRCAPFLATLRRFGVASGGPLSFPAPGWCLAIDMPAGRPCLGAVLHALDMRVADAGGRVYLASDARVSQYAVESMYGALADWRTTRDRLDPHGLFRSDLGRRVGLC